MNPRVALVTGAYGVIGREIARRMAAEPGFSVVMTGRDGKKLEAAAEDVRRASGSVQVRCIAADLSRPEAIGGLAAEWTGPLHVLVNNASATPPARTETPEGVETQFAVNVLGYFRMIRMFEKALAEGAADMSSGPPGGQWSRIVNVASSWAGDLDFGDLEFRKRRYSNNTAYRQSKQAERMLTAGFACLLKEERITVNACHPGEVNTPLSNSLGFGGHESPEAGADTPAWLALEPSLEGITGRWFEYRREKACRFMADKEGCKRLFALVEGMA